MGRAVRHWWGVGLPEEFRVEVPPGGLSANQHRRCEGEVQRLYVRKTLDGRPGWHVVGMICLGCGTTAVDDEALNWFDLDVRSMVEAQEAEIEARRGETRIEEPAPMLPERKVASGQH